MSIHDRISVTESLENFFAVGIIDKYNSENDESKRCILDDCATDQGDLLEWIEDAIDSFYTVPENFKYAILNSINLPEIMGIIKYELNIEKCKTCHKVYPVSDFDDDNKIECKKCKEKEKQTEIELKKFSEVLDFAKEKLSEGSYIKLAKALRDVHNES